MSTLLKSQNLLTFRLQALDRLRSKLSACAAEETACGLAGSEPYPRSHIVSWICVSLSLGNPPKGGSLTKNSRPFLQMTCLECIQPTRLSGLQTDDMHVGREVVGLSAL